MSDPVEKNLILIVDDQPEVRRMASMAVADAGYGVEVAHDGRSGLDCFMKHRSEICLVLADVIMPGMGGIEMVERILEIDPQTNVLFMTAYDEAQLHVLTRTRFRLICKPFLPADLLRVIADVLAPGGTEKRSCP